MIESVDNGSAESVGTGIFNVGETGVGFLELFQHRPRLIGAAIVNDDDFMRDTLSLEGFVDRGDRDRE